jgi:O-antigen/teichoic acid export membrane protein
VTADADTGLVISRKSARWHRMPGWMGEWLRDAGLLLSSQLIAAVATTIVAILLARSLGPSDWGLFSGLLGLSLALSIFVDFGLSTWLLRELSALRAGQGWQLSVSAREESLLLASAVSANTLVGGLLFFGAVVVLASLGTGASTSTALLGLITYTVLLAASICLETFYRAERRLRIVVVGSVLEKFLLLTCIVAVVVLDYGLWAVGVAYIVAGLGRLAFIANLLVNRAGLRLPLPTMSDIGRVAKAGLPFTLGTAGLNVIPRLDTFLLALFSTTAAGYFALGDRVLGPALIVPAVASAALYPFFSRERRDSGAGWPISAGMLVLGGAIGGIGALLSPLLVPTIFGSQYDEATRVVQIMCLVLPFIYASNPLLARLYTSGMERQVIAATLVASLVGTVTIVAGQLTIGPTGAAGGYVLRQILFTLVLAALSVRNQQGAARVGAGRPL